MSAAAAMVAKAVQVVTATPPKCVTLVHWQQVGAALKAAGLGFAVFEEWSRSVPPETLLSWHRRTASHWVSVEGDEQLAAVAEEENARRAFDGYPPQQGSAILVPTLHARSWWASCPEAAVPPDTDALQVLADRAGPWVGHWHEDGGLAALWSACESVDLQWAQDRPGFPLDRFRTVPADTWFHSGGSILRGRLAVPLQGPGDGTTTNLLFVGAGSGPPHLMFQDRPGYFLFGELDAHKPLIVCDSLDDAWACHWAGQYAVAMVPRWEHSGAIMAELHKMVKGMLFVPSVCFAFKAEEAVWDLEAIGGLEAGEMDVRVAGMCRGGAAEGAFDLLQTRGPEVLKNALEGALAGTDGEPLVEPRFKLLGSADLAVLAPLAWRVAGVLPTTGLAGLYGPSGSGKSFLALDLATAIAEGRQWFGLHTQAAPVVYVALEGEAGFRARVAAWEARHGRPLPDALRLVLQAFKLTEPGDVADLAAAAPPGALIVIDTLNRAAPHADENSSRDMGDILEAAKQLQSATGGLVLLVHHTGKDASRGMRGHSSLIAALDAAVEVWREGEERRWRVTKAKDGAEGEDRQFALHTETLGLDIHGDAITSCVVADLAQGTRDRMSRGCRVALDALRVALERDGAAPVEAVKARLGSLAPAKVLTEEAWRQATYQEGIAEADAEQDSKRRAFSRARNQLLDLSLVGTFDGYVWVR